MYWWIEASSTTVSFCHLKKQPLFLSCDPPPLHHSFLPTLRPEQSLIQFLSLWVFPIEDILHVWTSIICGLIFVTDFFHCIMFSRLSVIQYVSALLFSVLSNSTPLYCYTTFCLFIYSFIAIWIISTFWLFQVLIRYTICKYFSHCMNCLF